MTGRQTNFSLKERSLSLRWPEGAKIDRVEPENGDNSKTGIVSEDVVPNYTLLGGNNFRFNLNLRLYPCSFLRDLSSNYDRS